MAEGVLNTPVLARKALVDRGAVGVTKEFDRQVSAGERKTPSQVRRGSVEERFRWPELPNCALCGSPAEWVHNSGSWGYFPASHSIRCRGADCGIKTPTFGDEEWSKKRGTYSVLPEVKQKLLAIWSRRP